MIVVTKQVARQQLCGLLQSGHQLWDELVAYVKRTFPRLHQDAEDILQTVLQQVFSALNSNERWEPLRRRLEWDLAQGDAWPMAWRRCLQRLLRWRALDLLRHFEKQALLQLFAQHSETSSFSLIEPYDEDAPPPDVLLHEHERRRRQVLWLSDIFAEFVSWCESHGRADGCRMKEVYERRLHGQLAGDIAAAMGMTRNHVDQTIKRAREWIDRRIRERDVHCSVFVTLFGRNTSSRKPTPPAGQFSRFEDVLDFVVKEMGALCPSEKRLREYAKHPDDPQFADIRYHVTEVQCRLCCSDLQLETGPKQPA